MRRRIHCNAVFRHDVLVMSSSSLIILGYHNTVTHLSHVSSHNLLLALSLHPLFPSGCAMVTLNLPNPNLMMVAMSFGFGILCLAQFVGPLSGGHINCAVTFALWIGGRISLVRCVSYTFSQMAGAFWGAIILLMIFGKNWPAARAFGSNSWDESVFSGGQVFFAEMLGTMLLGESKEYRHTQASFPFLTST